jgi:hypothetical protein
MIIQHREPAGSHRENLCEILDAVFPWEWSAESKHLVNVLTPMGRVAGQLTVDGVDEKVEVLERYLPDQDRYALGNTRLSRRRRWYSGPDEYSRRERF